MRRKVDLVPGDALQHERGYINDKVDAEVERYVPQLLADEVIRIRSLVEPLIVHFRFLRRRLVMIMMIAIEFRHVIVDDLMLVIEIVLMTVRIVRERWGWLMLIVMMVAELHGFRRGPVAPV